MKATEKCKICLLKKRKPTAYDIINQAITDIEEGLSDQSMSSVIRDVNKKYRLKITPMNASRHKSHYLPQVIEIKPEQLNKDTKTTARSPIISNGMTFPDLDPKHEKFLTCYRNNGYMNKEDAYKEAGFGDSSTKAVYELLKRPEIKAAIYEMKASDFVAMRYTENQVLAGLMETAHFPEYWDQACDEKGYLKTNIKEWPEELRHAMCGYETTEDVLKSGDDDEGLIIRRKFKYKFSDPLKAKSELRKHGMEIEMYKKSVDKVQFFQEIIEKLLLNKINPITAGLEMGKHNLPVPDALKIAMQKTDPSVMDKPPLMDLEDMKDYSDEELERVALGDDN